MSRTCITLRMHRWWCYYIRVFLALPVLVEELFLSFTWLVERRRILTQKKWRCNQVKKNETAESAATTFLTWSNRIRRVKIWPKLFNCLPWKRVRCCLLVPICSSKKDGLKGSRRDQTATTTMRRVRYAATPPGQSWWTCTSHFNISQSWQTPVKLTSHHHYLEYILLFHWN